MKNFYRILLILALALVLTVGAVSLVSWKQTEGVSEKTVEPPQFSLKALFDGTFIPQFEEYYTATFPARADPDGLEPEAESILLLFRRQRRGQYARSGRQHRRGAGRRIAR